MKKIILCVSIFFICVTSIFCAEAENSNEEAQRLKEAQAIAQKLTLDTMKLRHYKDNRLYLEDVNHQEWNLNYFKDDYNLGYINFLENSTSDMLLNNEKKARLDYLYSKHKENAIQNAVPDPGYFLSMAVSGNWVKSLISVAGTAFSAYRNYKLAKNEMDEQYLIDSWQLIDEEKNIIDRGYTEFRNYFTQLGIKFDNSYTEDRLNKLISVLEQENPRTRLTQLTTLKRDFSNWSYFWLCLANAEFELEEYENCLEHLEKYFDLYIEVIKFDDDYSRALMEYAFCLNTLISEFEKKSEKLIFIAQQLENCLKSDDVAGKMVLSQIMITLDEHSENGSEYDQKIFDTFYHLTLLELEDYRTKLEQWFDGTLCSNFRASYKDIIEGYQQEIKSLQYEIDQTTIQKDSRDRKKREKEQLENEIQKVDSLINKYEKKLLPPSSTNLMFYYSVVSLFKDDDGYQIEFDALYEELKNVLWTRIDLYCLDYYGRKGESAEFGEWYEKCFVEARFKEEGLIKKKINFYDTWYQVQVSLGEFVDGFGQDTLPDNVVIKINGYSSTYDEIYIKKDNGSDSLVKNLQNSIFVFNSFSENRFNHYSGSSEVIIEKTNSEKAFLLVQGELINSVPLKYSENTYSVSWWDGSVTKK